jgi:predicted DNA-binding transcriptional regulator AlpA
MTTQTSQEVTVSPLLTLAETATMLRKSVKQLEWMIYAGTAPKSAKIGGRRMFRRADIEAFIEAAFTAEEA